MSVLRMSKRLLSSDVGLIVCGVAMIGGYAIVCWWLFD